MYHNPVMPNESIDSLNILSNGIYVDLTFGGGGHSKLILEKLSSKGKLVALLIKISMPPNAAAVGCY